MAWLYRQPDSVIRTIAVISLLVVVWIDYATGREVSVSILYIVPVALLAWFDTRGAGVAMSLLSATMWYLCNALGEHAFSHPLTPVWNTVVRLGFFVIASLTLSRLRASVNELSRLTANQSKLIDELQAALDNVKVLSGFIPICASCKKVRDDRGFWQQIEEYISEHSEALFSHSLCPDCARRLYPELHEAQSGHDQGVPT
jgi:hypothetical protein